MYSGLALNIGCGDNILSTISGFKCINVDIRALSGVDIICDVHSLPFPDNHFDRILASDIIEHFPIIETRSLLAEWSRVLKVGGRIKFRTPNLRWIAQEYISKKDAEFIAWHIFGGQDYSTNYHYVIFDEKWLSSLCTAYKLREFSCKDVGSNFELVMEKVE